MRYFKKDSFEVKNILIIDLFLTKMQLLSLLDVKLDGLLVDYCDVFISYLDSQSDGTHSLQMIHFVQIRSNKETISSTFWIAGRSVHFQQIFGWTIPLST